LRPGNIRLFKGRAIKMMAMMMRMMMVMMMKITMKTKTQ